MPATVVVNGQTVVHKGSGGTLTTSPDVCKTQVGSAVVPIPYVNVAKSADASNGSKTVACDSNPTMLKDSVFSKSTGDQPGKIGGVASGVTQGKARFVNYSGNVFIEGKNVCRRMDPMISNLSGSGNTPPAPLMQPNAGTTGKDAQKYALTIALQFKHPHVVFGTVTQPKLNLPYTISGPRELKYAEKEKYVGATIEDAPAGIYSFKFDDFHLDEEAIDEASMLARGKK